MRSLTVSRPASRCRLIFSGPPMRSASSWRRRNSSSSGCHVMPQKLTDLTRVWGVPGEGGEELVSGRLGGCRRGGGPAERFLRAGDEVGIGVDLLGRTDHPVDLPQ